MITILHTILIQRKIPNSLYEKFKSSLSGIRKDKEKPFEYYYTNYFRGLGFNEISLKRIKPRANFGNDSYYIDIKLNPAKLLPDTKSNLRITKDKHLPIIKQEFDKFKNENLDEILPDFYEWIVQRIDYTTDIKTEYVKEYMELIQKSDKYRNMKIPYHEDAKRRKFRKGSFYMRNKSVAINFYDKEEQLRNSEYATEQDILDARGILRYEVQFFKAKTNYIKYVEKFSAKHLVEFLDLDLARESILKYYEGTVGKGNFYKLDKARDIINRSLELKHNMKDKLIGVLELVSEKRSVYKARESFIESRNGKGNSTFNKYLKMIRALGINPVTIPRGWSLDFLENHYDVINERMRNESDSLERIS